MFQGHGCQVGVRDEIASRTAGVKRLLEKAPVLFGGVKQPNARLVEPTLDAVTRFVEGERTLVQARVGGDADEGGQHGPAKAQRFGARKLLVPPRTRHRVVRRKAVLRVKQKVRIDKDD